MRHSDHPRFQLEMALVRLMHLRKLVPLAELLEGGAARSAAGGSRPIAPSSAARPSLPPARPAAPPAAPARVPAPSAAVSSAPAGGAGSDGARERYLAAIKAGKGFFFAAVIAQAYRIDVTPTGVTFAFLPNQKVPRAQCEENREWLASLAAQTLGREVAVQITTVTATEPGAPPPPAGAPARTPPVPASDDELRQEALADPGVQALFEIFPVERTKIEEM